MNKKLHSEAVDQLFEAILCLKNKEECYTFFEDVCTGVLHRLLLLPEESSSMRWIRAEVIRQLHSTHRFR